MIADIIRHKLAVHVGKDNAIIRADLLDYLHQLIDSTLTDREMRRIIENELPGVCMCSRGYFLPKQKEEVEATLMFLNKKIYGLAKRKKQIEAAYPEYCQGMQLRLF